ncbi:GDYXXLXY domain-containing protein [Merismopedia glauca]|uniref:Membrane-anchored protein n=1 Tax=Merismopedia glauca CCAP 1448/3 TaxID=1296344 RepID=A0A2T1C0B1_9CYAN|nr:GDYXXLXY domain-containing protein [Merismopedia glauca]PSB01706.1 membrane-anchored protein [Merismopedia glauca CCAP 1448/3]
MDSNNKWLTWRLWLPLVFQSAIIIAIPAQSFYTLMTGKTVVFKTVPVDPYDFLRGYSQTLSYDISSLNNLTKLPGKQELELNLNQGYTGQDEDIYVVLEPPKSTTSQPPQPWRAVKVSRKLPKSLPSNQIAVKGRHNYGNIKYGLESYYMPESLREEINREIRQATWGKNKQPIVVEAKVDAEGKAVIESFWIGDRHYRF